MHTYVREEFNQSDAPAPSRLLSGLASLREHTSTLREISQVRPAVGTQMGLEDL